MLTAPQHQPVRALRLRAKRLVWRPVRRALIAYARGGRPTRGAERRVTIWLVSAWGMGGTIRANWNLAGWLAEHGWEVELLSTYRRRDEAFFGPLPQGVHPGALDERRPGHRPTGLAGVVRERLRKRSSVLIHPSDRHYGAFSLWTDVQLVRRLRGRRGIFIGTRAGINLLLGELQLPHAVCLGEEQMHHFHHIKPLRKVMPRHYHKLDALVVLTQQDVGNYEPVLKGRGRIEQIPNTVRDMGDGRADLSAKVVLAAGRFRIQKGFDLLIPAWAPVAADHPDWTLRLCGKGNEQRLIEQLIAEHQLEDGVSLEGPLDQLGAEMEKASIFPLSSRFEGFPLILLEAMSKGMAIVSYDCPTGPADIVDDHANGLLVPPRDVERLSAALREMVESEALRQRCATAAVDTAARYTMDAVGPRWAALLEDLLAAKAGR